MNRKANRIIGLGLLLFLLAAAPAYGFGGDVDYSGGGDSGGGDSGGGWSGGDSWDGGWSGSDHSNDSSSGSSPGNLGDVLSSILFIGVIGFIMVTAIQRKNGATPGKNRPKAAASPKVPPVKQTDPESIRQLREADRSFDPLKAEKMVREWVSLFEDAWCAMDMAPCREYIEENLFDAYQRSLAKMEQQREIPRTEDLIVVDCTLERWFRQEDREYLQVWIEEKKRTYLVGAYDPSHLVKGNRHTVYQLFYRWQLTRPSCREPWRLCKVEKLGQNNLEPER